MLFFALFNTTPFHTDTSGITHVLYTRLEKMQDIYEALKLRSKMTPLTPRRFYGLFTVAASALTGFSSLLAH